MQIRLARPEEITELQRIYDRARDFMIAHKNPTQWKPGYPGAEAISRDIRRQACYVCLDEQGIAGVFTFALGEDPTYGVIEDGAWHYHCPYGTIHRVAAREGGRGILEACVAFCRKKSHYLRIDTHEDNLPMQRAIDKNGFSRCGIIYLPDGSPRIAYDSMSH